MPNQLRDLRVGTVSLVSRAAVRDPRPLKAPQILLTKADHGARDMPADGSRTLADYEIISPSPVLDARAWQAEADRILKDDAQSVNSESPIDPRNPRSGLPGTADELSPEAQRAVQVALRALSPHVDEAPVGGMLGQLRSVTDGRPARFIGNGDEDAIEKALVDLHDHRTRITKGVQHASPEMRSRLANAERALAHEHLMKSSQGYARAHEAREAERSRQRAPLVI